MNGSRNNQMSSVSLTDIAKKAGVSRHTAGRVLSDKAHLHAPETVERIQQLADEMGYRPNLLARSVRAGRTMTVGIVLDLQSDSYSCDLLQGIHDTLLDADYTPLTLAGGKHTTELEQVYRLMDRRVDGLIVRPFSEEMSADYTHEAAKRGLPMVIINTPLDDALHLDFCGTDDAGGSMQAAEHLLSLGHRNFLHVTFATQTRDVATREASFRQALAVVPGTCCTTIRACPNERAEAGVEAIGKALVGSERCTAVFTAGDQLAELVYLASHRLRLRIPEDLSVVGFCDLIYASRMSPPLTTLRQDGYQIGKHAAAMLFERFAERLSDHEVARVCLRPELIIRESTAPIAYGARL